jgi:hypothetical protein
MTVSLRSSKNPPARPASPVRALNTGEAARYLGISPRTLQDWRLRGSDDPGERGPRFVTATPRLVLYEVQELDRWLDEKLAATDRAAAA